MIGYSFDAETGELIGAKAIRIVPGRSDLDDDNPSKWLVPACTTTITPPEAESGHVVCWREGAWQQVEDHRGSVAYTKADGTELIVNILGPLSDDVTSEPRPSEGHVWEDGVWVVPPSSIDDYRRAVQRHIEVQAQSLQYDGALALASYVTSTNPAWAAEAQVFVAWRDDVWSYALAELSKVQGGQREQPSVMAFLDELPSIQWPPAS